MPVLKVLVTVVLVVAAVLVAPYGWREGGAAPGSLPRASQGAEAEWIEVVVTCPTCGEESRQQVPREGYSTKVCPRCSHLIRVLPGGVAAR